MPMDSYQILVELLKPPSRTIRFRLSKLTMIEKLIRIVTFVVIFLKILANDCFRRFFISIIFMLLFKLKLGTTPGRAVYEVTVLYYTSEKRVEIDLTAISHTNKYGDDPHCIVDRYLFIS